MKDKENRHVENLQVLTVDRNMFWAVLVLIMQVATVTSDKFLFTTSHFGQDVQRWIGNCTKCIGSSVLSLLDADDAVTSAN